MIKVDDIFAALGIDAELLYKTQRFFRRLSFNRKSQLEFIEDFETWLEDSGNVRRACESVIASKQAAKEGNKPEAKAAEAIRRAVVSGQSIASGMEPWFDREVITVFATGEKSESLKEMVSDYMAIERELGETKQKFIKAVVYPAIAFSLITIVSIGFANVVLPQFTQMLPLESWPVSSRTFVNSYQFVGDWIGLALGVLAGAFVFCLWFLPNGNGFFRRKIQRTFPFSIYTYLNGMKVVKMMSLLVGKLYNPRRAAFEISRTAPPYVKWHLNKIAEKEASGEYTFAQSFNTGLMPSRTIQRMEASSAMGGADSKLTALKKAGERSGSEALRAINKSKRLVSTSLYVGAGAQLLFLIFAFFSLIIQFTQLV